MCNACNVAFCVHVAFLSLQELTAAEEEQEEEDKEKQLQVSCSTKGSLGHVSLVS